MTLDPLYRLIGPDGVPPDAAQMCWRALLTTVLGLAIVRMAGKRLFGRWGAIDIVISVVIGSNLSRALTGNAPFVPTILATAFLVALHSVLLGMAAFWPWLGPILKGSPRCLIKDGAVDRRAMLLAGIGRHDLQEALRCKGLTGPEQVEEAWLERDGAISVIQRR